MFFISDIDIDYRIDQDTEGCIIRGNGKYIEGNQIVYDVLSIYNIGGITLVKNELKNLYQATDEDITILFMDLANIFEEEDVLKNLVLELRNIT